MSKLLRQDPVIRSVISLDLGISINYFFRFVFDYCLFNPTMLSYVKDIEYVMECVTLAALPTLDMTRDILLQTRERISSQVRQGKDKH